MKAEVPRDYFQDLTIGEPVSLDPSQDRRIILIQVADVKENATVKTKQGVHLNYAGQKGNVAQKRPLVLVYQKVSRRENMRVVWKSQQWSCAHCHSAGLAPSWKPCDTEHKWK